MAQSLCILKLAGLFSLTVASRYKIAPLSDEEIRHINSVQTLWKAGRNFNQKDLNYAKSLLGVDIGRNLEYNRFYLDYVEGDANINDLPTNFDARQKWPDCKTMNEIRDQSNCGSCWAFGAVEAMSDRICVATGKNVRLSTEDVLACCVECGDCNGGLPSLAWSYYCNQGVVTGGSYGSNKGCMPYTLEQCEHHHAVGKYKNCSSHMADTPHCTAKCINSYDKTVKQDKHFGKSSYGISGVGNMMKEIHTNGPLTASFDVYTDFLSYKSGVYRQTTGQWLGGHAIKILGWGVENGTDYWLVANSWNEDWGDKGYFKIAKGINECQIEEGAIAGLPKE